MLFVIEGLDGCGKATQTARFVEYLKKQNLPVAALSFPDYDNDSSTLVKMYLNGRISENSDNINPYAASTFYATDRYISFKQKWEPIASNYKNIIVADRYTTANQLYQAAKAAPDDRISVVDWIADLEYNKFELPKPDFVVLLRMPVDVSQALMLKRYNGNAAKRDIHENNTAYLSHVYDVSTEIAKHCDWHIIDCAVDGKPLTIDEISEKIIGIYTDWIHNYASNIATKG